ncbi:hypothetical protein GCM10011497_03950 [Elstera cyanobacteriorum]|uniref:LysM domain-containing protein n=1 Tax=Elstera cyanobacteriorum TaxID=2022747 RepID=A0A255XNR8_9PROT|nr:LysM peptidoglycan-binding domain-containing M23 family metallopeptidase [Elstera cyanobacteriorum]OYQ18609.1 hypothetical protein CHR90_10065 [Elstera cyanobacteriorum]GFZ79108.1 hypothetical protein GCM10011497_03950 [Elstera cyanobacteriorum]
MASAPRLLLRLGLLAAALTGCGDKGFDTPQWAGGPPPPSLGRQGTQSTGIRASYVVQRGDTVYALAREFKVPVKTLIDVNDLQPPYQLLIGQRLSVPTEQTHTVAAGDTVQGIARRYNVDSASLARANDLREPYTVKVGQILRLPGTVAEASAEPAPPVPVSRPVTVVNRAGEVKVAALPPPPKQVVTQPAPPPVTPAEPAPAVVPPPAKPAAATAGPVKAEPPKPAEPIKPVEPPKVVETPKPIPTPPKAEPVKPAEPPKPVEPPKAEPHKAAEDDAGEPATPVPAPDAPVKKPSRDEVVAALPSPPPRGGRSFQWPVTGRVIATFGPQEKGLHNDGLNIAAPKGSPVRAAENGVVAYAGDEIRGFGNLLLIRHADGYMTAYAHNEVLLVNRGDTVRRGQVIARVGQTGNVSSPQLHFEIRKGTQAVDPEQFLGRPTASLPSRLTHTEG